MEVHSSSGARAPPPTPLPLLRAAPQTSQPPSVKDSSRQEREESEERKRREQREERGDTNYANYVCHIHAYGSTGRTSNNNIFAET